jgi:hypothetical protein
MKFVPAYCYDCGAAPLKRGKRITWMVHDHLWAQAGMQPDEHLCWKCLERRLGRKIDASDLQWVSR